MPWRAARPRKGAGFLAACEREGLAPLSMGTVQKEAAVTVLTPSGGAVSLDVAPLRNALLEAGDDMGGLVAEFRRKGEEWGLD